MLLNLLGSGEHVSVVHVRHTDNQLEAAAVQLGKCLILTRNLRKAGGIAQAQRSVFIEYLFVHPPVVLQHEGIVFGGNKQYIIDTLIHQTCKGSIPQHKGFEIGDAAHNSGRLRRQK
ncbi:hypothetical protein Barb7_02621 [Bacteroidales bacterium Barb7]|nr:hypothetical protein Barb7_02621 [Bacteroidales bacterium Barb7]